MLAAFARLQTASEEIGHYRYLLQLYPETRTPTTISACSTPTKGTPQAAIAEYRKALSINPADLSARNNLANILLKQGRLAEATQEYETILRYHPRYVRAYNNLGITYMRRGPARRRGPSPAKGPQNRPQFRGRSLQFGTDLPQTGTNGPRRGGHGGLPTLAGAAMRQMPHFLVDKYNIGRDVCLLKLYASVQVEWLSFQAYIEPYADGMGQYFGRP